MSSFKSHIEGMFGVKLTCEPIRTDVCLRITFDKYTSLDAVVSKHRAVGNAALQFRSLAPCALTHEVGVIALDNAYLPTENPNLDLSGSDPRQGPMIQDPPHYDPVTGITMIQKAANCTRRTPTFYAHPDEVRKAIAKLNRNGLPDRVCTILDLMQHDDYEFFSLRI